MTAISMIFSALTEGRVFDLLDIPEALFLTLSTQIIPLAGYISSYSMALITFSYYCHPFPYSLRRADH